MRLTLDLNKSIEENASLLFEKAKKAKKKSKGASLAASRLSASEIEKKDTGKKASAKVKTHWFMKYRWFFTGRGSLVIGGKDASTNEEIIKKRLEPYDLVFHAEIPGSPFFILKGSKGIAFDEDEKQSVANATASYSRAWKYGLSYVDVFCVSPGQVSKKARAGEYVSKGAFMIHGKKDFYAGTLNVYLSMHDIDGDSFLMSSGHSGKDDIAVLTPGGKKESDISNMIVERMKAKGFDIRNDDVNILVPGPSDIRFTDKRGA